MFLIYRIKSKIKFFYRGFISKVFKKSDIDFLIPGEIKNDKFSNLIDKLAQLKSVKNILEIGSSSGAGSTRAFINAINKRIDQDEVKFICLELSNSRFQKLKEYIQNYSFVDAYNLSSVSTKYFPSEKEVINFYKSRKTSLNKIKLEEVLRWRNVDINYIKNSGRNVCGIKSVMEEKEINYFDLCLIDGSEFTGKAELGIVLGAKYILLDDTETFKSREAFEILEANNNYKLIEYMPEVRNGFAAFERIN